jgi:hypothetical protein
MQHQKVQGDAEGEDAGQSKDGGVLRGQSGCGDRMNDYEFHASFVIVQRATALLIQDDVWADAFDGDGRTEADVER